MMALAPESPQPADKQGEQQGEQHEQAKEEKEACSRLDSPTPPSDGQSAAALTPSERRAFIAHGMVSFITELTFGLNSASMNLKLLQLSGGDMTKIATANAWHWCCNAVLKNFTTPFFSSLSDSYGRIPFWAVGRFSYFTYFLGLHLCRSLPQYSFVMVFGQW